MEKPYGLEIMFCVSSSMLNVVIALDSVDACVDLKHRIFTCLISFSTTKLTGTAISHCLCTVYSN